MRLDQDLFQKLNKLLAEATPTLILKRGNAFSVIELNKESEIRNVYQMFTFKGLNIYGISGQTLNGESYFLDKNGKEAEFETIIQIADAPVFELIEYELNLAESEIFIEIS